MKKIVKIECLACDETLELPQFVDTTDYEGQLVCSKCKALLHVKFVKGKLRKYKILERLRPGTPVTFKIVHNDRDKKPS